VPNLFDRYTPTTRKAKKEAEDKAGRKGMPYSKAGMEKARQDRKEQEERKETG